ncbi:Pbp1p [Kluyveromyces lactis]|uniref:KLLA0F15158p n=1 Tax=Kluyveromyces lactis (strain ATCC 8585 / CBS 2359 / DSM 70799 / NBRC 1267 / NRRL Y-1140 / WM37) TaxID=284590 RepID=Q6CJX9_KLULA|nr:uncharacterized protein KLLA0_F15158g [Kluyveromyces lactis]CAG98468.1 KLLA0F15158p [Kluyveromyces lactis]|eukprot:XP_455760.1 uncharacterized protein KLLA0_F15158g [Kluyveromyces lactis]
MRGASKKSSGSASSSKSRGNAAFNGTSSSFYETASVKKSFDERQDFLLVNGIGNRAIVTITSGVKYEGLVAAWNPHSSGKGIGVVLKYPKVLDKGFDESDINALSAELSETLTIEPKDVAGVKLFDVSLDSDPLAAKEEESNPVESGKQAAEGETSQKDAFKTDTAISGAPKELKERELQKWSPDESESFPLNNTSLEDDNGTWDQFAVNEKKFGIKPSFDEHFYTTRINKEDPEYQKKLNEAERIAKEIESQGASGNVHIDEDRNIKYDDSGLDEEDKYSGVDRRGDELLAQLKLNAKPEAKGVRYVPPSLRSQPHHADPAILSTTGKSKTSTRSEIADLKSFSEKFKIPYDMPDEVKTILKKDDQHVKEKEEQPPSSASAVSTTASTPSPAPKTSSTLKSNPSLPPKPASQPPTTPTLANASGGKGSNRSSKAGTPALGKIEVRRGSQNKFNGSGKTPIASPSMARAETFGRRRQRNFFDEGKPKCLKKDLNKNFNMFLKAKEAHESKGKDSEGKNLERFFIEKPYFTSPTWVSTVDQSYKSLFPDERTAIQRTQMRLQQRSIDMMAQGMATGPGGMPMGMPVGVPTGGPPFMGGHPGATAGSHGGMFMPFQPQPMFYPPMGGQMMPMMNSRNDTRNGSGANSQSSSPPATTGFMNGVPMNVPYGYPMRYQTMGGPPLQQQQHQQKQFHQNHTRNYRQHNDSR